jgi:sodium-dependent dicarboxylate transporter 2/3/5
MDSIQVALFFLISFLISRVFVILKIPELIVYYLIEKKHISIQKLTFILMFGTLFISTIVANIIAVLTLMPLVVMLQKELKGSPRLIRKLNTLILLSVLWGANIGGLGMITGTTTNGLLLGLFEVYKVPIARDFTYLSWAVWGLPMAIVLGLLGWLLLIIVFNPGKMMHKADFSAQLESQNLSRRHQRIGFWLAALFLISAAVLSFVMSMMKGRELYIVIATACLTIVYAYLILLHKWDKEDGIKSQLLRFRDTLHGIPQRGLIWVALAFAVSYVLWMLGIHRFISSTFTGMMQAGFSVLLLYLIFALGTVFATELISNTAIQFSMFLVLFPMVKINPDLTWQGMLIITLCSSTPFMTPLATPSNGLGYGSSQPISLKYMLLSGFIMNLICSAVIVLWVHYIVPVTLSLFF